MNQLEIPKLWASNKKIEKYKKIRVIGTFENKVQF
jgi:hypothetical protein